MMIMCTIYFKWLHVGKKMMPVYLEVSCQALVVPRSAVVTEDAGAMERKL